MPRSSIVVFTKKRMAISCTRKKDTKNADVSPSNRVESTSSNTLVRDGAIVDGLETFNDFTKKKMRPDECNIIGQQCKEAITLGGDAELELVDSLDPFSKGVVFSLRPPKKSWKNIAN